CMQENSIVLDEMLPQGALWLAAGVTGVLTTFLTQKLIDRFRLPQDASIALVFTTLFALGILLVTLFTKNMHLGVEAVMGNVDALGPADVRSAWSFFLIVLCLFSLGFRSLKLSSFDPLFARSLGVPLTSINYGLMILTAGGALVAFRAVGVLLFLALLVGPVLWARLFAYTLKKILLLSMLFGVVCSLVAVGLSRHILTVYRMPVSTSGVLVTVLFLAYLLALMVHTKEKKKNFFSQDTEQRVSDFERSQTTNLE
ncbi:MAG: metal ABC transporter permease, partial [Chlamydiae bacterium]|nr:metal ABC transporter permease [Chlamydiota bacterium]